MNAGEFVVQMVMDLYGDTNIRALAATGSYPVTVISPTMHLSIETPDEMVLTIERLRLSFRAMGVMGVRPEVVSVMNPTDTLAVVSLHNTRLGDDGREMGMHHSTYIVQFEDGEWHLRSISMSDGNDPTLVRKQVEDMFRDPDFKFDQLVRLDPKKPGNDND